MKLFISIPMNGRSEEDIKGEMKKIEKEIQDKITDTVDVLDTFYNDMPDDATGFDFISRSISDLGKSDLVYFAKDWEKNRGCIIEFLTAISYKKKYITYDGKEFNSEAVITKLPDNLHLVAMI